ncbi:hypothetical protein, partial [Rhodococcus erythropolis]
SYSRAEDQPVYFSPASSTSVPATPSVINPFCNFHMFYSVRVIVCVFPLDQPHLVHDVGNQQYRHVGVADGFPYGSDCVYLTMRCVLVELFLLPAIGVLARADQLIEGYRHSRRRKYTGEPT